MAGRPQEEDRTAAIAAAMQRLRRAERARRDAITDLRELGALRSRGLVADLGEGHAAAYYGAELAPPSTPGTTSSTASDAKSRSARCMTRRPTTAPPRAS